MKPFFARQAERVLESFCFTRTLFAFDYDGTLSRIVQNPEDAYPSKEVSSALSELCSLVPVAVISGRSLADLRQRIDFKPTFLIGNDGLEGLGQAASMQSAQTACSTWLKQMDKPLVSRSRQTGIMVEDKKYSLSVHYRKAPAKKLARDEIASVISQLDPQPRVIWGKCVAILASPHGPHKGAALLEAMHRAGTNSAFYIGDDDSDEDVFTIPDARIMTVRVGRKESSAAQYYVARQSEVVQVVRAVLKNMRDNSIEMRA